MSETDPLNPQDVTWRALSDGARVRTGDSVLSPDGYPPMMVEPPQEERALWALRGHALVRWHPLGYFVLEHVALKCGFVVTRDFEAIGTEAEAMQLIARGIAPELSARYHNTCSIGFSELTQKWYGWTSKEIRGFGVGDKPHQPGPPIRSLDEARQSAVDFAL